MAKTQFKPPATVYVLFHPASDECTHLATRVLQWLRLQEDDGDGSAVGLPVYFRTQVVEVPDPRPEPSESLTSVLGTPSPPIHADAEHLFIVPLVDTRAVADKRWRRALLRLGQAHDDYVDLLKRGARGGPRVSVFPVMVDRSLDQLGELSRGHNPLRIYHPADVEPGPPDGSKAHEAAVKTWREARARRLRRVLTEEMIRAFDADTRGSPERLKVFLSHAKADGAGIAQLLRDRLASVSKLEPWFDQNDLVAGRPADGPMEEAARSSSGGMIAVVTDAYPTRPWCWREAMAARTPRRIARQRYLTCLPTVAVHDARDQWSRMPPPLVGVPRIGWPDPTPPIERGPDVPAGVELGAHRAREARDVELSDRVGDVVDRLLLELLMSRVYRRVGQSLAQQDPNTWFVDFVPDARSLVLALKEIRSRAPVIVYPGHGLRSAEREDLTDLLREIRAGARLQPMEVVQIERARSEAMERLGQARPARSVPARSIVAVSAGGDRETLLARGLSETHVNDFTVRLTRLLLQNGWRVGFGGAISPEGVEHDLTRGILDAAAGWAGGRPEHWGYPKLDDEDEPSPGLNDPQDVAPVVGFVAKGFDKKLDHRARANAISLCHFRVIAADSDAVAAEESKRLGLAGSFDPFPLTACASTLWSLTHMRRQMATDCAARVLFAGKAHGWAGRLPGIAEELLEAVRARQPVMVLGGLGGCATLLHDFLAGSGPWPAELTFDYEQSWRERNGKNDATWACQLRHRRRWYEELQAEITAARATEVGPAGLIHLASTENLTTVLGEVLAWLHTVGTPRA